MYESILVPLDGSKRAETILPYVKELARLGNSTIILLQVIEPGTTMVTPYDMVPYYDSELAEKWVTEAKNYLAQLQDEHRESQLQTKCFVEQGPIVRTILEVAEREKASIIAMASHGRTGLGRVFYGSVAAGLLHAADRPILLVRVVEGEADTSSQE